MATLSWSAIAGLLVLVCGVAVLAGTLVSEAPQQAATEPSLPTTTVVVEPSQETMAEPPITGVDDSIRRVLFATGHAEAVPEDQVPGLRPEVSRVLAEFGRTLTVPEESPAK